MSRLDDEATAAGFSPYVGGGEPFEEDAAGGDQSIGDAPPPGAPEEAFSPYVGAGDPFEGGADAAGSRDILDEAVESALTLAADRPWGEISLRDVARAAGVPLAELYARADGKDALLDHLSRALDAAALRQAEADESADIHDRLFEATMARLEAMAPHRAALIALSRDRDVMVRVALRLPRTAKALLEAAGVDTGGARGALRVGGMTRAWARTLQVWRDDEGALNRTMAEIDKQLRDLNKRLRRVGSGF